MRVFGTGATGFVGSAVVDELLRTGHQVLGLVRSEAAAESLRQKGAGAFLGDLTDLDSLSRGVEACDGAIHTVYNHDFSKFAEPPREDLRVIETLGRELARSGGPLVSSSSIGALPPGRPTTEQDDPEPNSPVAIRAPSEQKAIALASEDVRSSVIRLPPIMHDETRQGLATRMIAVARVNPGSQHMSGEA